MKYFKIPGFIVFILTLVMLFSLQTVVGVKASDIYDGDLVDVVVNEDEREFRGVWVSALVSDVPRYQSKSQYQKAITNVLDNMEKYKFNTMVFHIRIYNDAFYESKYCKYSSLYRVNPDWEALPWIIEECHKRGIEFHAWMNPYRVSTQTSSTKEEVASKFPASNAASNPMNLLIGNDFVILNPGIPEVQNFLVNVCMEVVEKYDVDAIHFDDYFYNAGVDDSYTYQKYGSGYSKLTDFRRASVTNFIETLHNRITDFNIANDRAVKLGVSPTAIYRCGDGVVTYDENGHAITSGANMSTYFDQHYESACADTLLWIQKGYIDYIVPQLYVNGEQFINVSTWWDKVIKNEKCEFVAGITELSCEWDHIATLKNIGGYCMFSYKQFAKLFNDPKAKEYFKDYKLPNKASYMSLPLDYSPEIGVVTHNDGYEVVINSVDKKINYAAIYRGSKENVFEKANLIGYVDCNTGKSYYDKTAHDDNLYYGVVLISNDGTFSLGRAVNVKNALYKITYQTSDGVVLKTEFLKLNDKLTYPEYEIEEGKKYSWDKEIDKCTQSEVITLNISQDKYIIKFVDPDNKVLYLQEYNYGDSLNLPEFPESDKFIFKRWKVGGLYKVTGNDTIGVSFEYKYYDVNFYHNGVLIETKSMHIDEEIKYPKVDLEEGYYLVGWDKDRITGNMDINTITSIKTYKVSFTFDNEVIKEIEVNYHEDVDLNEIIKDAVFEKENYTLTGLKVDGKDAFKIDSIDADIIVEVVYEKLVEEPDVPTPEEPTQPEDPTPEEPVEPTPDEPTEEKPSDKKKGCGSAGSIILRLFFVLGAFIIIRRKSN